MKKFFIVCVTKKQSRIVGQPNNVQRESEQLNKEVILVQYSDHLLFKCPVAEMVNF